MIDKGITLVLIFLAGYLAASILTPDTKQFFVNQDEDISTGYNALQGSDLVCREALIESNWGPGGFGRRVPCCIEWYTVYGGALTASACGECELRCAPDIDCDGDVDLDDFSWLQSLMTGPL